MAAGVAIKGVKHALSLHKFLFNLSGPSDSINPQKLCYQPLSGLLTIYVVLCCRYMRDLPWVRIGLLA
jgi:hypothetical protein